jgi:tetratricopeptide (TPR) repeat protein
MSTMQPAGGMEADDSGMDDMAMPTEPCALFNLTKNDPDPPLYSGIGSAHWYVPWAQDYFDQGLRFYFGFNNRESYRAFRKAAAEAADKGIDCSACYWAQALVLGVDLNMSKQSKDDLQEAKVMLQQAINQSPTKEDREIIVALFARYQDCKDPNNPKKCQKDRNEAYYAGMKSVLQDFGRDDSNVITLFADAAMNTSAWAYWDGSKPRDTTTEVQEELERALSFVQYPRNEGPIHWYIHLMEQSSTPGAATKYADLLAPLAPNSGHLVHMPSHIYYRLGDMQSAINANKKAIEADERYFATEPDLYRPDGDRYRYSYYLHNIHFVIDAAVLSGDKDQDVNRYAEKLLQSLPDKANGMRADAYRSAYYLTRLNFASPTNIRKFPSPDPINQQPLANVAYDFVRLMADIWDPKDSKPSTKKLDDDVSAYRKYEAEDGEKNSSCDTPPGYAKPELCLAAILSNLGHARLAASNKNWQEAIDYAGRAVKIQDALRYSEPPMWPYPARQTLASILIQKAGSAAGPGNPDLQAAKANLLESLNLTPGGAPNPQISTGTFPGNGWAYYGLLEIAMRDGSPEAGINNARADLANHWFGADRLGADEFRTLERM